MNPRNNLYIFGLTQEIEKGGVGAMEIIAIHLKLRGSFLARTLSYRGVKFEVNNVDLTRENVRLYNRTMDLVSKMSVGCCCCCVCFFVCCGKPEPTTIISINIHF